MYKLYNGDCLEIMKDIKDDSIDMVLCDIPYGTTQCKWDTIIPFNKMWEQYNRIIKENGVIALFGSEPFSSKLRLSNLEDYRYDWYWYKNKPSGSLLAKKQPMKTIETISIFYKKQCEYYPIMRERTEKELKKLSKKSVITIGTDIDGRKKGWSGNRTDNKLKYPNNVLEIKTVFNRSKEKVKHPTQKPVELMEYLIKTYTKENELVLDNCMGSGTTGVACNNLNRNFIGIEINKDYFEIAERRMKNSE